MAYVKTNWEAAPSTNTPINPTNLNHIEQGIYDNSLGVENIGNLSNLETTAKTNLVAAINELKTSLGGTLLWTNSTPTTNFNAQEINVNLSDYDMIEILYNEALNITKVHSTGRVPKSDSNLQAHFNGVLWDRTYTFSNNKVSFGSGHKYNTYNSTTTTDNNGAIIPVYIIGYKTGLFS